MCFQIIFCVVAGKRTSCSFGTDSGRGVELASGERRERTLPAVGAEG